jgi:hypothetical protein
MPFNDPEHRSATLRGGPNNYQVEFHDEEYAI